MPRLIAYGRAFLELWHFGEGLQPLRRLPGPTGLSFLYSAALKNDLCAGGTFDGLLVLWSEQEAQQLAGSGPKREGKGAFIKGLKGG